MAAAERLTVTLPADLLAGIDAYESNRSRFISKAVRHELQRLQQERLLASLASPHPDSRGMAGVGLSDWGEPAAEDSELLDAAEGQAVQWIEGRGWINEER